MHFGGLMERKKMKKCLANPTFCHSYGYDADIVNFWNPASTNRLGNHAENLVGDLLGKRERTDTENRKMIFVAHSLGGLVTEYALDHSRNAVEKELHQIERCTIGIAFLGVPHHGAELASWASYGAKLAGVLKRTNQDILRVLNPGSETLRDVENRFHKLLRLRKDEAAEIAISCFAEELPVTGVGEVHTRFVFLKVVSDSARLCRLVLQKCSGIIVIRFTRIIW